MAVIYYILDLLSYKSIHSKNVHFFVNLFVRTFHHFSICVFEHLNLRLGNFFHIIQISITNLQHIKIAHSQHLKATCNLLYSYSILLDSKYFYVYFSQGRPYFTVSATSRKQNRVLKIM